MVPGCCTLFSGNLCWGVQGLLILAASTLEMALKVQGTLRCGRGSEVKFLIFATMCFNGMCTALEHSTSSTCCCIYNCTDCTCFAHIELRQWQSSSMQISPPVALGPPDASLCYYALLRGHWCLGFTGFTPRVWTGFYCVMFLNFYTRRISCSQGHQVWLPRKRTMERGSSQGKTWQCVAVCCDS